MIRFLLAPVVLVVASTLALAQQPTLNLDQQAQASPSDQQISPGMTSEIWFYMEQWKRHDDPKQAVRRKAEYRAEQRLKRMAATKWYGQSKHRPMASPMPYSSTYSPFWSGFWTSPYPWFGPEYRVTVLPNDEAQQR